MNDLDRSIQKTTLEQKGDWKPIIFLFTDGNLTDNYSEAFRRWNEKYRKHCNLIAVSIGDNVNVLTLAQITDDILLLKETDAESFTKFFKWVTASIKTTSMSVSEQSTDEVKLAPTTGINLDKVDPSKYNGTVDENFAVLHGRCQTTKNYYLVKYAKRGETLPGFEKFSSHVYKLVGAYPVDKESYSALSAGQKTKINTMELVGIPTCPCCGNQHAVVVCECGGIFCVGEQTDIECPWCGLKGELTSGGEGGMDITRGLG